jgi:hypothetical protein
VEAEGALRTRAVIRFWIPLAATWLMMSAEGPYIAAIIARRNDAAFNLAAYGVAFVLAWLAESPIMMLMTAANTLVRGRQSFLAMRRFMYILNCAVTAIMAFGVLPPVFRLVTRDVMQLPPEVAHLVHIAVAILIPWPAAIGYRRFYQGVLVRNRLTRRVAYGTIVRLTVMSVTAATLMLATSVRGSTIGALALASGVVSEAVACRWMARHVIATILATPELPGTAPLTQAAIVRFYYPLALTSMISMGTGPLLTMFAGRGRSPIESLAVLPVVQGLLFVFRGGGVAFQEVGVALSGRHGEHAREVGRASLVLACASTCALALVLFTPFAHVWLGAVAGLSPALAEFALTPARLLIALPALEYWLSLQRTSFILNGQTRVITIATAIEVGGIAAVLLVAVGRLGMTGAVAASVAMLLGRLAANAFLLRATPTRTAFPATQPAS